MNRNRAIYQIQWAANIKEHVKDTEETELVDGDHRQYMSKLLTQKYISRLVPFGLKRFQEEACIALNNKPIGDSSPLAVEMKRQKKFEDLGNWHCAIYDLGERSTFIYH